MILRILSPVAAREAVHLLILQEVANVHGGDAVVLKGGMNLRLFFGSVRYSEDMDLDGMDLAFLYPTMAFFLAEVPDLDVLIIPIGGGGLIAGNAIAAKALKPEISIIGVEATLYPSMYQAIHHIPTTSGGQTIAEGIAAKRPGELTRPIVETS